VAGADTRAGLAGGKLAPWLIVVLLSTRACQWPYPRSATANGVSPPA